MTTTIYFPEYMAHFPRQGSGLTTPYLPDDVWVRDRLIVAAAWASKTWIDAMAAGPDSVAKFETLDFHLAAWDVAWQTVKFIPWIEKQLGKVLANTDAWLMLTDLLHERAYDIAKDHLEEHYPAWEVPPRHGFLYFARVATNETYIQAGENLKGALPEKKSQVIAHIVKCYLRDVELPNPRSVPLDPKPKPKQPEKPNTFYYTDMKAYDEAVKREEEMKQSWWKPPTSGSDGSRQDDGKDVDRPSEPSRQSDNSSSSGGNQPTRKSATSSSGGESTLLQTPHFHAAVPEDDLSPSTKAKDHVRDVL